MGWTADWTGNQAGCDQGTFCRLYVHYSPLPNEGHWGSLQTFRLHPGVAVIDDGAIMTGRWTFNTTNDPLADAYWVKKGFFAAWLGGLQGVGLAITTEVGGGTPRCPTSVGCVKYQRFHVGYIWQHSTQGIRTPVFCPDVYPYYPNQDYGVSTSDIFAVAAKYGATDAGLLPFQAWADSFYDTAGGDGAVTVTDVYAVAGAFGDLCYPP